MANYIDIVEINHKKHYAFQNECSLEEPKNKKTLNLKSAIMSSYRVKEWLRISKGKWSDKFWGTKKLFYVQNMDEVKYILDIGELFARAYEQYIWTKLKYYLLNDNNKLFQDFNEELYFEVEIRLDELTKYYWNDRDFIKILKAFDNLFDVNF